MSVEQTERQTTTPHNHPNKSETNDADDAEFIINDIGGSFGKFQLRNYALYSIPIAVSGIVVMTYVFTALNLDYRCRIPECDDMDSPKYNTDWLKNIVPIVNSKPSRCYRYEQIHRTNDSNAVLFQDDVCDVDAYNHSSLVRCDQAGLVYKTNEVSIVNEFNLTCEENEYKLAIIGTYNNIARFLFMPVVGLLSDRYGRKFVLILGLALSSLLGWLQSFSINYTMYIILEFLNATTAGGVYPAAFILSVEWASTNHRVIASQLTTLSYNLGIALSGLFAAYAREFRLYLRMTFTCGLITAVIMIFSDESLRWLLARGKRARVGNILEKVAKFNNRQLSSKTYEIVQRKCEEKSKAANKAAATGNDDTALKYIFMSRKLLFRFAISSFSWMVGTFVTYGVSIISVSIHEDRYWSFILVALGGVPSGLITVIFLKYFGRPRTIALCYFITGSSILSAKLLPPGYKSLAVLCFMIGKLFGQAGFSAVYIQTTEIWPTCHRHAMMSLSSTIGRFGSILAPLTPLLANITEMLPYYTFGFASLLCSILILFLPETRDVPLPENLEEARNLGTRRKDRP